MTGGQMAAAALAGVPAGVQAQGVWAGRRQLLVRFAGEAETATMYSSSALVREIERQLPRSRFHSISIGGKPQVFRRWKHPVRQLDQRMGRTDLADTSCSGLVGGQEPACGGGCL